MRVVACLFLLVGTSCDVMVIVRALGLHGSTILGEPQILGGPAGGNFDSPFHAFSLRRVDGSTRLVGYNSNSDSYRVLDGESLTDWVPGPATIGSIGATDPAALDHCGCWLQAVADLPADKPGVVRGFNHEEFKCDYAHNSYTNKSIAYAESTDGGGSFTKVGWPSNQIIQAAGPNTTVLRLRHGATKWAKATTPSCSSGNGCTCFPCSGTMRRDILLALGWNEFSWSPYSDTHCMVSGAALKKGVEDSNNHAEAETATARTRVGCCWEPQRHHPQQSNRRVAVDRVYRCRPTQGNPGDNSVPTYGGPRGRAPARTPPATLDSTISDYRGGPRR
eukprot:m.337732 g.337732  ORF g.337732 m.337732 type:complete len:334 (+) comp27796_c0_seq21:46-1047(+)